MILPCDFCKHVEVDALVEPCLSCNHHSKFKLDAIMIPWIEKYAETKVGPAHTAIVRMIEDWKNDKDK